MKFRSFRDRLLFFPSPPTHVIQSPYVIFPNKKIQRFIWENFSQNRSFFLSYSTFQTFHEIYRPQHIYYVIIARWMENRLANDVCAR